MVDASQYIQEGIKLIDTFIDEKNFAAAYRACQELTKVNPYDRTVQKYLKKIERLIVAENEKKVDHDIDATEHLWKEERYDDLMRIYAKLYQYAPEHARLRKLLEKLSLAIAKKQTEQKSQFESQSLGKIESLIDEKKFDEALQAAGELLAYDPLNSRAAKLAAKAKDLAIEQKLEANERLMDSADFERQAGFYESLLRIDPNHSRVKKLLQATRAHLAERNLIAEKIHLNESVTRMKALFDSREYEKVLQSCEEIDRLDPGNFNAKLYRKKAAATMNAEIEDLAAKKLKEVWAELRPEYEKNPGGFVTI